MQPQHQLENEMLDFVLGILHKMGHRVGELRALADSLLRPRELNEHKTSSEGLQRISDVAEELAQCIRNMRFLYSYHDPGPHDFLTDVVHPAVFAVSSTYRREVRLVVDPSARSAPRVMLRPGPAVLGLMLLLSLSNADFIEMRLKAVRLKGGINFRINLDAPGDPHRKEDVELRATSLLETAGARVKLSRSETGYLLDLKIDAKP